MLTVTDNNGNVDSCMAIVTIGDTVPPVAICQDTTVYLNAFGTVTIDPSYVDGGSAIAPAALDQSQTVGGWGTGSLTQWQSFTAGASGPLAQVDLRVNSGLSGVGQNGIVRIYAGEGVGGALLATENVFFAYVLGTFQQFPLSGQPLLTAGQQYTIQFSVPSLNVTWVDVNINNPYAGGRASNDPNYDFLFKTYISSDLCTPVTLAISASTFTCDSLGARTVYLYATDSSGNSDTCTSTVTVMDTIAPFLFGNNAIVYLDSNGGVKIDSSYINTTTNDNCGVMTITLSKDTFSCIDGPQTQSYLNYKDFKEWLTNSEHCTISVAYNEEYKFDVHLHLALFSR